MDIRHLRTFVTVARLGSVTRAAEALHITQPAVSGQLKTLEEELEVKLLSRTTSSVKLTQCGQALLRRAERAIEAYGDFVHAAKSFRGQIGGQLRVGVTLLDPMALRVGEFMAEMSTRHPALKIDLQMGRIPWLLDALRSAELDAALLVGKAIPKDMGGIVLKPLRFVVVAPAAWRERLAHASWQEAAQLPWIRMTPNSAHAEMLQELLDRHGVRPAETVLADHESLIYSMVAADVGIGLLRDELARHGEQAGVLTLPFADVAAETKLAFIYPSSRAADPALEATVEVLRSVWQP